MSELLRVSGLRFNGDVPERKKVNENSGVPAYQCTSVPAYQFEQRTE
jgi:hypothetical protein